MCSGLTVSCFHQRTLRLEYFQVSSSVRGRRSVRRGPVEPARAFAAVVYTRAWDVNTWCPERSHVRATYTDKQVQVRSRGDRTERDKGDGMKQGRDSQDRTDQTGWLPRVACHMRSQGSIAPNHGARLLTHAWHTHGFIFTAIILSPYPLNLIRHRENFGILPCHKCWEGVSRGDWQQRILLSGFLAIDGCDQRSRLARLSRSNARSRPLIWHQRSDVAE